MPSQGGRDDGRAKVALVKASSLDEARKDAAALLGVPAPELELRILERHRTGFLGLGGEELKVEARWSPPAVAPAVEVAGSGARKDGQAAPATAVPAASVPARLTCKRGRVSLAVTRSGPGQRAATRADIDAMLVGLPLSARDDDAIMALLQAPDGNPRVVASVPAATAEPATDPFGVHVAADGMRAWLVPWEGGSVADGWVESSLAHAGIIAGIDRDALAGIAEAVPAMPLVIAVGKPAVSGSDATVTFAMPRQAQVGHADASDEAQVDHREVKAFGVPATVGQAVATKVPVVPAIDGENVRGEVVPGTVGKDFDLQKVAGKGVRLSDDGLSLIATASGSASWVADKLCVAPLTAVSGDVDFSTGNVRVEGDLTIAGTVSTGFHVEASGNIAVSGAVEGAFIRAGGNVAINGGFIGQDSGTIDAEGSVSARFVEGGTIRAGGNIVIGAEARLSTLLSDGAVMIGGGRGAGRITGGLTRGRVRVEANEIGAHNGTPTRVQAGWGRELDPEDQVPVAAPRVLARAGAHPGVSITVAGASAQITAPTPGGYWRDVDGKLTFVPAGR